MARAVVLNVPAHGHINPTLPWVAELVRRGEVVTYYAVDEFRPAIEATGASFRSYGDFPLDASRPDPNPLRLAADLWEATEVLVPRILTPMAAERPDYVIHDSLCPWGKAAAEVLGIPRICSTSTFAMNTRVALTAGGGALDAVGMAAGALFSAPRFRRAARRLRDHYPALRPALLDALRCDGDLNIVHTSRQFQPAAGTFPARYRFVGRDYGTSSDDPGGIPAGRPLLYASLGTLFNTDVEFYRNCIAAFADWPGHLLLSVGNRVEPAALGALPANVTVRNSVPQLAVLQRASAFVTHGGMNSVQEALYHGVPLVVVPQAADQAMVAARVRALGAGVVLSRRSATPARLRHAAERILADPAWARRSRSLGDSLRAGGGHVRAADEVQRFTGG